MSRYFDRARKAQDVGLAAKQILGIIDQMPHPIDLVRPIQEDRDLYVAVRALQGLADRVVELAIESESELRRAGIEREIEREVGRGDRW